MADKKCPRCSDVLVEENLGGVTIDRCRSCAGVWLDDGEIVSLLQAELAVSNSAGTTATAPRGQAGVPLAERESVELCPKCQTHLNAVNYDYGSGVIIDVCPRGHGLWLDKGELEQLKLYKLNSENHAAQLKPQLEAQLRTVAQSSAAKRDTSNSARGTSFLAALAEFLFFHK
jgi:Zn-finger nucleic acid-binding protein